MTLAAVMPTHLFHNRQKETRITVYQTHLEQREKKPRSTVEKRTNFNQTMNCIRIFVVSCVFFRLLLLLFCCCCCCYSMHWTYQKVNACRCNLLSMQLHNLLINCF